MYKLFKMWKPRIICANLVNRPGLIKLHFLKIDLHLIESIEIQFYSKITAITFSTKRQKNFKESEKRFCYKWRKGEIIKSNDIFFLYKLSSLIFQCFRRSLFIMRFQIKC